MNFTVEWGPSALGELMALFLANPPLRAEISDAWPRIDPELAVDAHLKGTALDNYRIVRIGPLAILYTVLLDRMHVQVARVSISASAGSP